VDGCGLSIGFSLAVLVVAALIGVLTLVAVVVSAVPSVALVAPVPRNFACTCFIACRKAAGLIPGPTCVGRALVGIIGLAIVCGGLRL